MQKIKMAVEKYRDLILEAERFVWAHPETGYKEEVTGKYMEENFCKLGYDLVLAEGIPGFYTVLDTGRPGPEVLVLGELDSIICPNHPESDPQTGAVHSCGHNVQCAALLGVAAALKEPGILDEMSGRIRLCAVPAEELLEIEYRAGLKQEGKIKYFGGKTEFMHRGYFDGVDLCFIVHASTHYAIIGGNVGCITKNIIYKGKSAHAGGSPWEGRNALYAATCGINAVNAIRETFKEKDLTRVHPIVTQGGSMVNAIPEQARLESYVRGSSFDAIIEANRKVDRALIGAALSLGTNVEIIDVPGYAPLVNDRNLMQLSKEVADRIIPEMECYYSETMSTGSTDVGDLCFVMPAIHLYSGGTQGTSHGDDYFVTDPEAACVKSAQWQIALLQALLENGAARAKEIVAEYKAPFTSIKEYLAFIDSLETSGDRIKYTEGGANIKL